jgi:HSP20 family molecular chaperone IbpA
VHRTAGRSLEQHPGPAGVLQRSKPRQWRYQTRPSFKRVRGPLIDVFNEAEEVLIVVDLGGFTRGDISLSLSPRKYVIQAARGEQQFSEVIELPPNVDAERAQERLVNGVLEIILPRKEGTRLARAGARQSRKKGT